MSKKKYLITGGTGFLGSALVRRLLSDGHEVTTFDDNSRGHPRRISSLNGALNVISGDIRNPEVVRNAFSGMEAVVHMAAVNGTEFFYSKPELVLDVAVRGILNVIDSCRHHNIGELSIASSSEVYQQPTHVPTSETERLIIPDISNPRYSYAGGKLLSELVAFNYGLTGFERVTVFRPHNVYGPDMGWEHVIPQLSLRLAENSRTHPSGPVPLEIQGDGSPQRAFIHIDDFTAGLMLVLNHGEHRSLYHIGNPEEISISTLARKIAATRNREIEIIYGEEPSGATNRRCPDINKLIQLGFKPSISIDDGLKDTVKWYFDNAHLRSMP